MQAFNNLFYRFFYILSVFVIAFGTGCTHKHVPYPTKDLVPKKNTMSIDGIWQSDTNSNFILNFESGRAYTEKPVYKNNGTLLLAKNAVIIKNITKISPLKYSCNQGARNKFTKVVTFDVPGEIEVISTSILKLHTSANPQLNTIEKTLFFKKVSLRNKEAFLKDLNKRKKQKKRVRKEKITNNNLPDANRSKHKIITEKKKHVNIVPAPKRTCTIEQILKLKEMGMTDSQVKAACK